MISCFIVKSCFDRCLLTCSPWCVPQLIWLVSHLLPVIPSKCGQCIDGSSQFIFMATAASSIWFPELQVSFFVAFCFRLFVFTNVKQKKIIMWMLRDEILQIAIVPWIQQSHFFTVWIHFVELSLLFCENQIWNRIECHLLFSAGSAAGWRQRGRSSTREVEEGGTLLYPCGPGLKVTAWLACP